MASDIYWIAHPFAQRIAIAARPRADDWIEDEIDHWHRAGVRLVVSLLEPDEVTELGLQREPDLCIARGIDFSAFPIPDRCVPDSGEALTFLRQVSETRKPVILHCRAGIGRSSLMAASLLALEGMDADRAFALIKSARGVAVPDTEDQRQWVIDLRSRLARE
ncbi:MAG: dual specificity protein phosphatase family protein [Candidatus Sphingomonas phytovorans]|nr:dual specificity protein phosphatase family protein [Sphingomonas sp.]WEJ98189.1 MAG: dual specificity protein phosphatase family protein [Sphingomonas sp.]